MRKYFVLKIFKRWLDREGHRFLHKPTIQRIRWKYFILRFEGVTPKISCIISRFGSVGIWVSHRKECWDGLADFDLYEKRNKGGQYYCELCDSAFRTDYSPDPPEMFTSREELWIKHSFEPLLEWCNEHLQRGKMLLFLGGKGRGYWEAVIRGNEELEKMKADEDFVYACPVVLRDTPVLGIWQGSIHTNKKTSSRSLA
jgi:hypothetical protein